jgi:hypothetical protein
MASSKELSLMHMASINILIRTLSIMTMALTQEMSAQATLTLSLNQVRMKHSMMKTSTPSLRLLGMKHS